MRVRMFILHALIIALAINLNARASVPKAVKGVIDLRNIGNSDKFIVKLNGEWEFYWEKILRPDDFKAGTIKPDYFGNVPSYWTDYPQESVRTEKFGYATYRLTVLLPPGMDKPLALDMPVFDSSYDVYINGKHLGGNGIPGKSEKESKPEYKRNFFRINPESDSLVIIIAVSNYNHRRGGFWLPVKLGTFPEVQRQMANKWAGDWSVISILLGFSVFFLFFFAISPRSG